MSVSSGAEPTGDPMDVTIIGGGVAGASLAAVLGRAGIEIAMIEPLHPMPPRFRAEKIEPDQAELLRGLGLLEGILEQAARIRRIDEAIDGRLVRSVEIEQYGIFYQDLVNQLRRAVPAGVSVYRRRAVATGLDGDLRWVRLEGGREIRSRLVVVACGIGRRAQRVFGLSRRSLSQAHSFAFGFSLARHGPKAYAADALTYFGTGRGCGIDAISLFPMPTTLRANLFTYWPAKDRRTAELAAAPLAALGKLLPGFAAFADGLALDGKLDRFAIELDRAVGYRQPGLVVLGDAFQSVCPATGTGLSKVLTDVDRLAARIPGWLASPGMAADKIEPFYRDPAKVACDKRSLEMALRMRRTAIDPGLRWRLQRTARRLKKALQGRTPGMAPAVPAAAAD